MRRSDAGDDPTDLMTDLAARRAAAPGQLGLVLFHRDGVRVVPIHDGDQIVVGRSWPADIVVADRNLSRQHALFRCTDGELRVEDLDSTNGTVVDGVRVDEAAVAAGSEVVLGPVTVSVQELPADALAEPVEGVESHEAFQRRLEEELARAQEFRRPLGLAMFRTKHADGAHASRWIAHVRANLRRVDHIGFYSASSLLVALPELDGSRARAAARGVVDAIGNDPEPVVAGIAIYPDAARTSEELVELARTAARAATTEEPVCVADAGETTIDAPLVDGVAMRAVFETIDKVASSVLPVLVLGETGAGKEVVARAVHERSSRRHGPLRFVNCGAIPDTLIESTLFGHEKGAFTGADRAHEGVFEEASSGTVVLDEVGELSPAAQAALLRVLETKKIVRVGATAERDVDVRVVAATHRDLETMCEEGSFRSDLLYRLNGVTVRVPALRDRSDEIVRLARHFLAIACRDNGIAEKEIDPRAMEALRGHDWPGNVRELRNVMERAAVVASGEAIGVEDLSLRRSGRDAPRAAAALEDSADDFKTRVKRFETDLILGALERTGGVQSEAAQLLKIPVRTLTYKLKAYGIRKKFDADDE